MQIDFHHTVTYVAARNAGFAHDQASLLAYAAQYVDDATDTGHIGFLNGALYNLVPSAHESGDAANLNDAQNRVTWQAFHFLPGNGGLPSGQSPSAWFIDKLVCTPGSYVAHEMIRSCILEQNAPYALHRLGITMHVYADTWAHQQFAGIENRVNEVNITSVDHDHVLPGGIAGFCDHVFREALPPVGHARALTLPDLPFLNWQYTDGYGTSVRRDNTGLFLAAADALCRAMQAYRAKDADAATNGITPADMNAIRELFLTNTSVDPLPRHQSWIEALHEGRFSFGPVDVAYAALGALSWRLAALQVGDQPGKYVYSDGFLACDWKLFHDALLRHQFTVLHDILPRYGICSG